MKALWWAVAGIGAYLLYSSKSEAQSGDFSTGGVSFYGPGFNGKLTASGETFDQNAMTAAHKTLPFGTMVQVTDLDTGNSVQVRINDRGPFVANRILDLSVGAATKLGIVQKGVARNARIDIL